VEQSRRKNEKEHFRKDFYDHNTEEEKAMITDLSILRWIQHPPQELREVPVV
jgi:hypothetical protein